MCKSQPADDKLSLIEAWSGHVTIFLGLQYHIFVMAEPKVVKCCKRVGSIISSNRMTYHQQKGVVWSHDCLNFFSICRDAARHAGFSATAELIVLQWRNFQPLMTKCHV